MANLKQRRLSREERRSILDRVREWQLAEPALREPATQTELARELGVHQSYVSRILSHTPATVLDSVIEGDQEALIMHRRIVRSIAEDAVKGDPKARELYLKYISQPYRVPPEEGEPAYAGGCPQGAGDDAHRTDSPGEGRAKAFDCTTSAGEKRNRSHLQHLRIDSLHMRYFNSVVHLN